MIYISVNLSRSKSHSSRWHFKHAQQSITVSFTPSRGPTQQHNFRVFWPLERKSHCLSLLFQNRKLRHRLWLMSFLQVKQGFIGWGPLEPTTFQCTFWPPGLLLSVSSLIFFILKGMKYPRISCPEARKEFYTRVFQWSVQNYRVSGLPLIPGCSQRLPPKR